MTAKTVSFFGSGYSSFMMVLDEGIFVAKGFLGKGDFEGSDFFDCALVVTGLGCLAVKIGAFGEAFGEAFLPSGRTVELPRGMGGFKVFFCSASLSVTAEG